MRERERETETETERRETERERKPLKLSMLLTPPLTLPKSFHGSEDRAQSSWPTGDQRPMTTISLSLASLVFQVGRSI
jgi:hypothetical protein